VISGNLTPVTDDHSPPNDDNEAVVALEITDHIDLHGFRPRDVPSVVESYLEAARAKGMLTVRLIHGRGVGVQRARVQSLLTRLPYVVDFAQAPTYLGGWGATVVELLPMTDEERNDERGK
jgi:dsDNA-specific endonuclease/ATPase MutS2